MPPPAPLNWTDYVQAASWVAAALTAVIGLVKFTQETRKARAQRDEVIAARQEANAVAARELEWRRAVAAQTSLEKMESDPRAADAMLMLDWDVRRFSNGNETWLLRWADVVAALRTRDMRFSPAEVHVRDAFDRLFWHFERIQHQIDIGLVTLAHVQFPLAYLVTRMDREADAVSRFLRAYGYRGSLTLVDDLRTAGLPPATAQERREGTDRPAPGGG